MKGNCGGGVFYEMLRGRGVLHGDFGDLSFSFLKGGEVVAIGNGGEWIAEGMESGVLRIKGNVKSLFDPSSGNGLGKDAVIYVNGDIGNIDDIKQGKIPGILGRIYHRGKLITGR